MQRSLSLSVCFCLCPPPPSSSFLSFFLSSASFYSHPGSPSGEEFEKAFLGLCVLSGLILLCLESRLWQGLDVELKPDLTLHLPYCEQWFLGSSLWLLAAFSGLSSLFTKGNDFSLCEHGLLSPTPPILYCSITVLHFI